MADCNKAKEMITDELIAELMNYASYDGLGGYVELAAARLKEQQDQITKWRRYGEDCI